MEENSTYVFPLSFEQKRLWILSMFDKLNKAYNISGVIKIKGDFNLSVFTKSINDVISKHESLRTTIKEVDGEVCQVIMQNVDFVPIFIDLLENYSQERVNAIIHDEAQVPFNIETGPLLKVIVIREKKEQYSVFVSMHHIISDGWSLSIFIKEISISYNNNIIGVSPTLSSSQIQYADFTIWEKEKANSIDYISQLNFWKSELEGHSDLLHLPTTYQRPLYSSYNGAVFYNTLSTNGISELCAVNGVTEYMFFIAVFFIELKIYSNQSDITLGTSVANRNLKEFEDVIGFFVSTLLVRSKIDDSKSFVEYLQDVKNKCLNVFSNKDVPFERIIDEVNPKRNSSYNPLFQVMFEMDTMPIEDLKWVNLETSILPIEGIFSKFDITFSIRKNESSNYCVIEYSTDLFDEKWIKQFADHYQVIINQIVKSPMMKLSDICLLDESEKDLILNDWNNTRYEFGYHNTIWDYILESAKKDYNKKAIVAVDGQLTYRELIEKVNMYSSMLKVNGIGEGDYISVCLKRELNLVPTLLAIMNVGATYIPIDPNYPYSRIKFILEDSGSKCLVTNNTFEYDACGVPVIYIEDCREFGYDELSLDLKYENPVYIIYTSGSTGKPKGVRIGHQALLNFIYSMQLNPGCEISDKLLAISSLSFDISGLELYLPLVSGATLVIADDNSLKNAYRISDLISQHNISIIQATPSTFRMLKEISWSPQTEIKILCGGEALIPSLAEWLLTLNVTLWNMYGPTETTIWSSIFNVKSADYITIGRPIHNTKFYILDECLNPLPVGIPGVLYIAGLGLATDYFKRPDLTAEKFINWHNKGEIIRIYNTGDIAVYNADGTVNILGRIDSQVKVNGHRIELGEIESKLLTIPFIDQTVVVKQSDNLGNSILIAYIQIDKESTLSVEDIMNELKRVLPNYMIPNHFVKLDTFPLTPNGKIDKNLLPNFGISRMQSSIEYVEPVTEIEKILTNIWEEVLGINKIGINDNYFNLGGASIQSISISAKAETFGIVISPEQIFEYPTINELSKVAKEITGISTGGGRIIQDTLSIKKEYLENNPTSFKTKIKNTVKVESIGVYLPEKEVFAKDIVASCKNEIRFPLERLTGITSVRVSEVRNSFELAAKAIEDCLAMSKYTKQQIDLLIVCNIFQMKGEVKVSIEPRMSLQLKKHFGLDNAFCLDITNACTGMFTSIMIAESFINSNLARACLLVSGEYISHVTRVSQLEVENYMDTRIAGLTLGDSGFAMVIDKSINPNLGFIDLDLFTMGKYSNLCVVKATKNNHGGMVVNTDAIKMGEAGQIEGARHTLNMLRDNNWNVNDIDFIIMHQASSTTTQNTMKEINKVFEDDVTTKKNVVDNIKFRGNTATTTHWIALSDNILNDRINNNNNIVFSISGSGLTLGTGLYHLDDLPERYRNYKMNNIVAESKLQNQDFENVIPNTSMTMKIVSSASELGFINSSFDLLYKLSTQSINESGIDKKNIDTVIYNGVYRDDFVYEPAIATLLIGYLEINSSVEDMKKKNRSFAFDICDGGISFLKSCYISILLANNYDKKHTLISSSEINLERRESYVSGGASIILSAISVQDKEGFGRFVFKDCLDCIDDLVIYADIKGDNSEISRFDKLNYDKIIDSIILSVSELLKIEEIDPSEIDLIFPPLISEHFVSQIKSSLNTINVDGCYVSNDVYFGDMSSVMLPYQFDLALKGGFAKKGAVALIISLGGGFQLGCSIYYF